MCKRALYLSALSIFLASNAFAHQPTDIRAVYDTNKLLVSGDIYHSVANPKGHYISKVNIVKNGVIVETVKYDSQTDNERQIVAIQMMGVKPSDKLEVEAFCNLSGFRRIPVQSMAS